MKIGDYVKTARKQSFQLLLFGQPFTYFSHVEGRIEAFEMEGKMVQIKGLLHPTSEFQVIAPAPSGDNQLSPSNISGK